MLIWQTHQAAKITTLWLAFELFRLPVEEKLAFCVVAINSVYYIIAWYLILFNTA